MAKPVSVVVATFGSLSAWEALARRAVRSAEAQEPHEVIRIHGASLHEARNAGLAQAAAEWVVHLDADDELAPGYLDALLAGSADVRAPAVSYLRMNAAAPARMPRVAGHTHDCVADCLPFGNWLVVGAMARAELLRRVGGWRDWPVYEDWCLWLRCHLAGASFEAIPRAVYRAHVRVNSRNRQPHRIKLSTHQAIARAHGAPVPA